MDHLIDDSDRTKPCPFCGGHASMHYVDRGCDAGGRYIACDTCDASTGLRFACGEDPTPLLLEQWNKRAPGTLYCWLVENGKQAGHGLAYRRMDQGMPTWTEDPHKAMRFARRADAEMFAEEDEDAWRIVEHGFDA